ncbi:MAG: hypothetical protein JW936_01230 [Sedimentisphaerales bacterium]|nr:hypothetical protein [Sedimentisphaerales bacterium]
MGNKAQTYKKGEKRDYTNGTGSTVSGGTLKEFSDGKVGLVLADIANGDSDGLQITGIIKVEKKNEAMSAGLPVGFDSDGDPYGGTASSGAATLFLADADMVCGYVWADASATATHCYICLNEFTEMYPYFKNRIYETKSDDYTIDAQDTGKVIQIATDAKTLTLTAVAGIVGCDVVVQNLGADAAVALTLSPNASDKIAGPDIAGGDNKDLVNTKTTAIQGDWLRMVAGTDWFVKEMVGTWATEA